MAGQPDNATNRFEFLDGDVRVWIEQETIHLIARDRRHNDPVELTTDQAREIAAALLELAKCAEAYRRIV